MSTSDDKHSKRPFPGPFKLHNAEECPRCHDTGRIVVCGISEDPEDDITVIYPCPECRSTDTSTLSRFFGLPEPVVLSVLLVSGALVVGSLAMVFFDAVRASIGYVHLAHLSHMGHAILGGARR